MRKGTTTKILSLLAETGRSTAEFLDIFLTDYATSYRMLRGLPVRGKRSVVDPQEFVRAEKQRFYNLLSKLKREGLVRRTPSGIWRLTHKGVKRNSIIAKQFPAHVYTAQPSRELVLVTFDIPERERRKRTWLRAVLKHLNFRMLQRSVWIGKVQLPAEFLHDLRTMRLLPYIEMLVITKTGSVEHIKQQSGG